MAAAVSFLMLASCGGSDDDSDASPTGTPAVSPRTQTTVEPTAETEPLATTTTAAATTTTTQVPATTAAPTTTVAIGSVISRDAALAANDCFDRWHHLQQSGQSGQYLTADADALDEACDQALALIELDQMGVPTGPYPIRQIASIIADLKLNASIDTINGDLNGCVVVCEVDPTFQPDFLVLDLGFADVPPAFQGTPLFAPTIENIGGLVLG